jgi:hypothetical protein
MTKLIINQAYLVQDKIYGEEYYAYFDGEKVLVDFPPPLLGMRRFVIELKMKDFLNQYTVLEECPEAKQIFS